MVWSVEFSRTADRQFARLDSAARARILDYFEDQVAPLDNPRTKGRALSGPFAGLWRYRIGDYRAICHIDDAIVTILIVETGHRSKVYRGR